MLAPFHHQSLLKSPCLSVVFGPRNVLRDKQRRLISKNMGISSLNVQWWSLVDIAMYSNLVLSIKATFLEVEKTLFTVATVVPLLIIITPGTYTRSKQSKTFHANCNLMVKCEKKNLRKTKVIVWVLQIWIIKSDIYAT